MASFEAKVMILRLQIFIRLEKRVVVTMLS